MGPRARAFATTSNVMTRAYRNGAVAAEGFDISAVSENLDQPDAVVWVDICMPSPNQLAELDAALGLHELAIEDALDPHQRPKVDRYATHTFLSCHAVTVDLDQGALGISEIDAFFSERWLLTVRKDQHFPIVEVLANCDRSPELLGHGVGFLLYGLLDVVVDGYFDVLQTFDDYYDRVSEVIFSERPLDPADQRQWFNMRRAMVQFHRLAVPLREAVSSLMRREHLAVPDDLVPYYQDVYDHILRVSESSDALRDLVSTIVETSISLRDYRQNQVVKQVTSWAAIIAVPTLITGFYGMNVPYPGSGNGWGVLASTALMLAVSGYLFLVFRRRDWL